MDTEKGFKFICRPIAKRRVFFFICLRFIVCRLFFSLSKKKNTWRIFTWDAKIVFLCSCNVWSFVACINHLRNHKSATLFECIKHTEWDTNTHREREIEVKFPVLKCAPSEIVLLSHIFNFDFITRFFFFFGTHFPSLPCSFRRLRVAHVYSTHFCTIFVISTGVLLDVRMRGRVFVEMINCDIIPYLQPAMLHFDFVLNLIEKTQYRNRLQHRFHVVNAPPEI